MSEVCSALTANEEVQGYEITQTWVSRVSQGPLTYTEPRRLVGKGRSGQRGMGHNLCLVNKI